MAGEIRVGEHPVRDQRCPYCHAELTSPSATWECPRCQTVHHASCAKENGRCTLLGCGAPFASTEQRPARSRTEAAPVATEEARETGDPLAIATLVVAALAVAAVIVGFILMASQPHVSDEAARGGAAITLVGCGLGLLAVGMTIASHVIGDLRQGDAAAKLLALGLMGLGVVGAFGSEALLLGDGPWARWYQGAPGHGAVVPAFVIMGVVGFVIGSTRGWRDPSGPSPPG